MLEALQNAFFQTGDALTTWLSAFSSFLWGWPLLIMLLGTHLYLTVILRFPQRYLLKALKLYFVKDHTDKGDISPFSSLMVALPPTSARATSSAWGWRLPPEGRGPFSGAG